MIRTAMVMNVDEARRSIQSLCIDDLRISRDRHLFSLAQRGDPAVFPCDGAIQMMPSSRISFVLTIAFIAFSPLQE